MNITFDVKYSECNRFILENFQQSKPLILIKLLIFKFLLSLQKMFQSENPALTSWLQDVVSFKSDLKVVLRLSSVSDNTGRNADQQQY